MLDSSAENFAPSKRRIATSVFLCIAVPLGIVSGVVYATFSGRPLGRPSRDVNFYVNCVRNGELWFLSNQSPQLAQTRWRVKRMNLQTGIEYETGLEYSGKQADLRWIGDEFYVFEESSIYKKVGSDLVRIGAQSTLATPVVVLPFMYDGQLTKVVMTKDAEYRLIHLSGGAWSLGRKILLPNAEQVWSDDDRNGRRILAPSTSARSDTMRPLAKHPWRWLDVINDGPRIHVFLTASNGLYAYRNGIELDSVRDDEATALLPENSAHEASGWELVPVSDPSGSVAMGCSKDGPFFQARNPTFSLIHRNSEGEFGPAVPIRLAFFRNYEYWGFIADPADGAKYLIGADLKWNSVEIHRFIDNHYEPVHLLKPGSKPGFAMRWRILIAGFCLAWFVHLAILIAGMRWVRGGATNVPFEFGIHRATLAPASKRLVAFAIDLCLVTCLLVFGYTRIMHFEGKEIIREEWELDRLLTFESKLKVNDFAAAVRVFPPIEDFVTTCVPGNESLIFWIALAIPLFGLFAAVEWCSGVTPGKWIVGLRTVRFSLRPCGFDRILLRNVLYSVDVPFLVTPLPAAISMMLSPCRQRLGDRVADTVVVEIALHHKRKNV